MFTLYRPPTISSLRRQLEALKRKFEVFKRKHARVIAAGILKPVARQISKLWKIAVEKKQPMPNPLACVRKVVDAGFRLNTLNALHGYIQRCRRYDNLPEPEEIISHAPAAQAARRPPRGPPRPLPPP